MTGEGRRPGESFNDYCCRVDDELALHEPEGNPLAIFLWIGLAELIVGLVAWYFCG